MSRHHVLQRLIVRLLHDPTQLRRLYAEPEWARERFKISEEEYRWLTQIDARRWEIDPERPHRSLEGALAHCPVTALIFSSWCEHARRAGDHWKSGVEELIAFYQSEAFHLCIERQERLAESLMAWLLSALERRSASASLMSAHGFTLAMIELEISITRLRNELETPRERELAHGGVL